MNKIKVLYAEDERIVGRAIINNLRNYNFFDVGDLITGDILNEYNELADLLVKEKLDVLLLDMELNHVPDGGIKVLEAIKKRKELDNLKVLIVSTRYKTSEKELIKKALNIGVSGFIGKNADWEKLVDSISMVYNGQKNIFSQSIIDILASNFHNTDTNNDAKEEEKVPFNYGLLTKKEKEVFKLICQGIEKKMRLMKLKIVSKTYETHWSNIKEKLDIVNEVQCLLYALENGIEMDLKSLE